MASTDKHSPLEPRHEDSLPFILRETHKAFVRALEGALKKEGLSSSQWYVLRTLWNEEGLTQAELSHRIRLMTPTTVTTLNQMEAMGLVKRAAHPEDKRKFKIFLTSKGRALENELLPVASEIIAQAMKGLSKSRLNEMAQVLLTIQANLRPTDQSLDGG